MSDSEHLQVLDRQECLALLKAVRVGRLVFSEDGLPTVHPVNFRIFQDKVIIRVAGGGKLAAAAAKTVVAFEVDELDPDLRSGWSVTVVGHASVINEIDELVEVAGVWLQPWAEGRREHFIGITMEKITGRRLLPSAAH